MNVKLFYTVTAAIIVGVVVSYLMIRWLWRREELLTIAPQKPSRGIGFAAILEHAQAEVTSPAPV
jgi:hypothetical protein